MTRSTKRMLNDLAKQGYTAEEQFQISLRHEIGVRYKSVLWFNDRLLRFIDNGSICLDLGAY
jgi:hypothetical protein